MAIMGHFWVTNTEFPFRTFEIKLLKCLYIKHTL